MALINKNAARPYNLGGLIKNISGNGRNEELGQELEISNEIAIRTGRKPVGVYVPFAAVLERGLVVGTPGAGGNTVETVLETSRFINKLMEVSIVARAGARILSGLQGGVAIPRQTSGATAYWVSENGAPTETQAAFDQVAMSPKTVGAYTDISRKMLLQSGLDITSFVQADLAAAIGFAIDAAAINGSGLSNQPTGILNASNVQTESASNAVPTWANIVSMETKVANVNANGSRASYLITPEMAGKLKATMKDSASGSLPIIDDMRDGVLYMNNYAAHKTNHLPKTLGSGNKHALIYGNFDDLLIGQWGALDIVLDPYSLGTSGAMRITAFHDVDIALRHPESFCKITDAALA